MSSKFWFRSVAALPKRLLQVLLYLFVFQWILDLVAWIRRQCETSRRGKHLRDVRRGQPLWCSPRCIVVPRDIYKRADPMIYDQYYLMEQGLAVTWDNPDIQLYKGGVPVSSDSLEKDTDYRVVATIRNNSTDAPAVGMPVVFSYLSFGVGMVSHPIGTVKVNLPVKGAPGHPVLAEIVWHTPKEAGHYCLQVLLVWPDDANPKNNLGQENTNVGHAASPAVFKFPVRNGDTIHKLIEMTADAYVIPPPLDCRQRPRKQDSDRRYPGLKRADVAIPVTEEAADWTLARARHGRAAFPIPAGWSVVIEPSAFELAPGDQRQVTVTATPPDNFRGEHSFNIDATFGGGLLGGVTLKVRK